MNGLFTIVDRSRVLEREDHLTLHLALVRVNETPWSAVPWAIFGPDGRLAATPSLRIPQQRKVAP